MNKTEFIAALARHGEMSKVDAENWARSKMKCNTDGPTGSEVPNGHDVQSVEWG